jgi:SAM-dependent methyltransferase
MIDIYTSNYYKSKNPEWHLGESQWKAKKIHGSLKRTGINPRSILDYGCGLGGVVHSLKHLLGSNVVAEGIDLSSDLIANARLLHGDIVNFNVIGENKCEGGYDLILLIDVFEHVSDFYGLLEEVKELAAVKVFHIPLDLNFSNILFKRFTELNLSLGHIHYFNEETVRLTLENLGYELLDVSYTRSSIVFAKSWKEKLMIFPRLITSIFSPRMSSDLFGGFSLLVVCK